MSKSKNVFATIFCILGVLSLVFSITCYTFQDDGQYELYERYGGDAYTGIQQASASAANNTKKLIHHTMFAFGGLFFLLGGGLIAVGCSYYSSAKKASTVLAQPASADNAPELYWS